MIKFKKHMKAGQCNAMRCKELGEHTYEPGDRPPMLLCDKHWGVVEQARPTPPAGVTEDDTTTGAEVVISAPASVIEEAALSYGNRTAVVVPHADALALATPMLAEYNEIGPQLVNFVIDSQWGMDTAGALLKEIKGKLKRLEAKRKEITQPLLQGMSAVNALFKPARKAGEAVEASIKKSIAAYVDGQRQAQVQALQAGQHATALAVEQPAMPTGVSTTITWKWRIVNAAIIPREYWAIDSVKVQGHVNAHKGQSQIPGIEVYCETGVRSAAS